jgi:hypothetical protein
MENVHESLLPCPQTVRENVISKENCHTEVCIWQQIRHKYIIHKPKEPVEPASGLKLIIKHGVSIYKKYIFQRRLGSM